MVVMMTMGQPLRTFFVFVDSYFVPMTNTPGSFLNVDYNDVGVVPQKRHRKNFCSKHSSSNETIDFETETGQTMMKTMNISMRVRSANLERVGSAMRTLFAYYLKQSSFSDECLL